MDIECALQLTRVSTCPSERIVKAAGDWTNRLYDLARTAAASGYSEKHVDAETQGPASVKMMVEGPYGTFSVIFKPDTITY